MASTSGPTLEDKVRKQRTARRLAARDDLRSKNPAIDKTLKEFQPDAVEIENMSIPGGMRWTLYTVVSLVIVAVVWSCWAEVDKIVNSSGKIITTDTPVVIQISSTAPIRSMEAEFGQIVRAGDILATLDPTFSDADVAQLEQKLQSLGAEIARLNAEQNGNSFDLTGHETEPDWLMQNVSYLERRSEYIARIAEFQSEKSKLDIQRANNLAELEAKRETLKPLQGLEKDYRRLNAKGSISDVELYSAEIQARDTETSIIVQQGKDKELLAQIDSNDTKQNAFIANWRVLISEKMVEAVKLKQAAEEDLKKARRSNELVQIRVPDNLPFREFYVLEVADRTVGSVVQPGEALFKLAPLGSTLEIEVEIPGKDVSNVRTGDQVRIKLVTFPYQKNGWLEGTIRTISEGSFEKETSQGTPPVSVFRARVELNAEQPNFRVKDFRLLPGMVAESDIKVGKRRVIEYIMYPLFGALNSSIREP
jgi:HlyD family secretion protein